MIRGLLFDLDGVIVDTAKYHFVAWQRMAAELGIHFGHEENEQLKGISRVESLERILSWGGIALSPEEKQRWMDQKKTLGTSTASPKWAQTKFYLAYPNF